MHTIIKLLRCFQTNFNPNNIFRYHQDQFTLLSGNLENQIIVFDFKYYSDTFKPKLQCKVNFLWEILNRAIILSKYILVFRFMYKIFQKNFLKGLHFLIFFHFQSILSILKYAYLHIIRDLFKNRYSLFQIKNHFFRGVFKLH